MYRFGTVYLLYRELYVELCVAELWLLEAELAEAAFLPNAAWPSDHLLVAADVVLPRALELRPGGFERLAVAERARPRPPRPQCPPATPPAP